ncbi:hypothetical protein WR25_26351 isoform A [Diploscapter pachys]|uniref:Uncharacterized protein n=3 Tax=Diploscapter pachys TaxID=2018661 RepID=A0A2A2JJA4_9BILA|nr:hypothetical protein WR25_26351 isoform A [Diploscapter pachys]
MASLYNFILSNAAGILRNLYLTLIVLSLVDFELEKDKKQSALTLFRQIHPFMVHIIWCGFLIPSFFAYNYESGLNYLIQPLSIFALLVLAEPIFQYLIDARNYIGYYIKSSLKTANSLAIDCIVFLIAFFNSYLACALMSLKMILYASSPMRLMLAVMCTVPLMIMALSNTLLMTRSLQDYYVLTPLVVHVAQILTGYRILPFFVPKDDFDSHNIFSLAFKYVLVPFVIVYFVIFWPGLWFAYGGFVGISAMHTLPMSIVFVVGITVLSASFLSTHSDRSGAESVGLNLARIWGYTD